MPLWSFHLKLPHLITSYAVVIFNYTLQCSGGCFWLCVQYCALEVPKGWHVVPGIQTRTYIQIGIQKHLDFCTLVLALIVSLLNLKTRGVSLPVLGWRQVERLQAITLTTVWHFINILSTWCPGYSPPAGTLKEKQGTCFGTLACWRCCRDFWFPDNPPPHSHLEDLCTVQLQWAASETVVSWLMKPQGTELFSPCFKSKQNPLPKSFEGKLHVFTAAHDKNTSEHSFHSALPCWM